MTNHCLAIAACALLHAGAAHAQRPLNLDMEQPGIVWPELPWGWDATDRFAAQAERQGSLDTLVRHGGRRSLRVRRTDAASAPWTGSSYLPVGRLAGKRIRLTGWTRTEGLRGGTAVLRVESMGSEYQPLAVDSMAGAGVHGTTGWTRLAMEATVDTGAAYVLMGVQVSGAGTAWFDDLVLEVDGQRIATEPGPPPPSAAERGWLRAHAVPFASVQPGDDDADLEPFRAIVGDARLVSLGEGTHGTREFFLLKHRLIEHLVRRMGFTVVMLEANQLQTERVNRYVLTGEGTARDAMSGLFRVWKTEEMLAMIEWLRAWNASGQGRVEVVGYDMQDPRLPMDSVLAFLARSDPRLAAAADSAYGPMRTAWLPGTYPAKPDSVVRAWSAAADGVRRHMRERASTWLAGARTAADSAAVAWALQNADVAYQAAALDDTFSPRLRDSAMAANIQWTLAQRPPGTRAAVWAHNGHVSRQPPWMGGYLDGMLPGQVRVFGFTTAQGEYSAAGTLSADPRLRTYGVFPIAPVPPPAGGVGAELFALDAPLLMVDLRGAGAAADGAWLMEARPSLSIGAGAVDYGYFPERLARDYDVLLYVRSTTASRPLSPMPPAP